ncbi:RNA polymerase sigma factor [Sphingobacterium sp. MYb382]|uniref:RNA polymerase sigma factor n=1 Tax=Sphingobacterium sp. MYb382 TaxID=2745278 RepID=UPI0030A5EC34
MDTKEINIKISECGVILKSLAYKFTRDPEDIQDLVQETLMRSLKYMDQFFQNPKLISWLYVIMKNVYINQFRRQQQKYVYDSHKNREYHDTGYLEPTSNNNSEGDFVINDVDKLLNNFPKEHKEMFCKFIDGYKYSELSTEYNTPEGTIKSRIHFIRKTLRRKLSRFN